MMFRKSALLAAASTLLLMTGHASAQSLQVKAWAAACANCHGTNGRAQGSAASLAGQPASELVKKMNAFIAGERPATVMHQIAKGYTPEQINEMAAFFAAQK